ncbi:kynureninase [Lutibacter flavus]|uniref:Kynureninase n=1 Tax=Lutibacter flavus TaxID=691689 RepID=A0A238VQL2_9FLAO|nr:kynureninase [Lutibacter flavus]SNR36652.1 Kynureninase [Lutibacter flavus]
MNLFEKKALELDQKDSLAHFKNRFVNDSNLIYLDGNSLGKLPKATIAASASLLENQWGNRLIRSWNEEWIDLSNVISKKIAKLVGAQPDEIFVGDTTSLNLYKLVYAALEFGKGKEKIITDALNFPSDLYVLEGLVNQHFKKHQIEIVGDSNDVLIENEAINKQLDLNTALLTLSLVTYKSSFMYNMKEINELAHAKNSLVLWDLSHAVGAVPIDLNKSNADLAVGCTYKYLNGGPGAPAFLYVKKSLQEKLRNPIWSWFSHEKPFDFNLNYQPGEGIHKFAVSTPSILSLAPVDQGVSVVLDAGMENLRIKSVAQSSFLLALIEEELIPLGFKIASPLESEKRGSHIAIQHSEGYRINQAMIQPKVGAKIIIPDFRPPNNIRLGIAPLYITYMDLYEAVQRIKNIVEFKEYEKYSKKKALVT